MKRGRASVLLGFLWVLCQGVALAGVPGISDLSDNTVGYGSPSVIDNDILFEGGGEYRNGSVSFSLSPATDADRMAFQNDTDPNASGALSVEDGLLYLGTGSDRVVIGTVDSTENGENGQPYTIHFKRFLNNGDFESGNADGWTWHETVYPSTPNNLDGRRIHYRFGLISGTGTIDVRALDNHNSHDRPVFDIHVETQHTNSGSYALHLRSSATIEDHELIEISRIDGNGSLHGPYILSDAFEAGQGDQISFSWAAGDEDDAYEVLGFLVNVADNSRTHLFSQRGDNQNWTNVTASIPANGTYRFEFICGSYDRTGRHKIGASFYLDNIGLAPRVNPDDALVSEIARHITYENTNSFGLGETLTVTVTVESEDGSTTSASADIVVAAAESPEPFITVNTGLSVTQNGKAVIDGTVLNAADPDSPDESLVFELTGLPAHGQLEFADQPGVAIDSFTRGDLENSRIVYVHDGTDTTSDTFEFSVTDKTNILYGQSFTIIIKGVDNIPPELSTNTGIQVAENGSAVIGTDNLSATDPDNDDTSLQFILVTGPGQGRIENSDFPGVAAPSFTQADLAGGKISYVHTGTGTGTDSFVFDLGDGTNVLDNQTFTIIITAAGLPLLTTTAATGITATSLSTGGHITSDGGSSVVACGVCWGTEAAPTVEGNHVTADISGTFQAAIGGLVPGMTYIFRAYAVNDSGVAYGEDVIVQMPGNSLIGSPWSDPASWTTGAVPGQDDQVFVGMNTDLEDKNIQIDSNVDVASLTISGTFEGTLTLSQDKTLATGEYVQNGGTVDCTYGKVDFNGDFILNGGVFIAPRNTMAVNGDFIHSGGTFSANGGTVVLDGAGQTIAGDTEFYNLSKEPNKADTLTLGNDTDLAVAGTLTLEGASDEAPLALSCAGTPTSLIIEANSKISHLSADDGVQLIFKSGAGEDGGNLPVAALSHTPSTVTRTLTYSITVGGFGVTHYRYNLDGQGWVGAFAVDEPIEFTLAADGYHTLSVVGRDSEETWQDIDDPTTISWRVDTTAPVARVSGCPEGTLSPADLVLTVSGEDETVVSYSYSLDGGDWSDPAEVSETLVLTGLGDGAHILDVIASDAIGNWQATGDATQYAWTFESAATDLAVTLTGVPEDPTSQDNATVTVDGEGVVGYRYSVDGGPWVQATVNEDIVLTGLDDGRHTLSVSGLASTDPVIPDPGGYQTVSWTVDTVPSDAPDLGGVTGHPPTTVVILSWTWSTVEASETLSHYQVYMAKRSITADTLAQATPIDCDLIPRPAGGVEHLTVTGLTPGTLYHFVVRTVDRAGNVSGLSNDMAVLTSTLVPEVTAVEFTGGGTSANNGEDRELTITGENFSTIPGGNLIRFENGPVVFDIVNTSGTETELIATLPAGAPAGTYNVRVINDNGVSGALEKALTITQSKTAIPVVLGLSPSLVARGTTASLTITGQNFTNPVAAVRFERDDDTILTAGTVTRVSDTTLTASLVVPADAVEGSYTVVVENAGGLANGVSAVNLRVVEAEDLDTAGGPVVSSGIVNVTGGEVPVDLTLTTDNSAGADAQNGYPLSVILTIPAGSTIEENNGGTWVPYTGPVSAPAQAPLDDDVASQLGSHAQEFTMGAENPLRLANGDSFIVTMEVTVPQSAPVPSLYVVNDDGSVSLAGIAGTADGVDYVPGGTVLNVEEDVPEDGMVTYTIGVMLAEMDNLYALGGGVKGVKNDYGPCLIGASAGEKIPTGALVLVSMILVLGLALVRWGKAAGTLVVCLILVGVYSTRAAADETRKPWYILAGAGYQMINEENSAIYFGVDQSLAVDNDVYPVIRGGYNFSDRWALELGFRYDIMSGAMETTQPSGDDSVKGYSLLVGPVYRLKRMELPVIGKFQPFLKGDLGYRKINNGLAYAIESYDSAFGLEAAVGVEKGPFDFRLGYACYNMDRKDGVTGFEPAGSSSDLSLSGVFAELTYRFSFGKATASTLITQEDSDGDGVPNTLDKCPDTLLGAKVNDAGCPFDDDKDGVINEKDQCPDTPQGASVNLHGCTVDTDGDGVSDAQDACPDTPAGTAVDDKGCPLDSDGDGVADAKDACPNTPKGEPVDEKGCPVQIADADGDGVADSADACPDTPMGMDVGPNGCPLDEDQDGVPDNIDQCPGTPSGAHVDERGCWPLYDVNFDTGSADIKPDMFDKLKTVIDVLQDNLGVKLEVQGHTDAQGDAEYNRALSEKRAKAIRDYLVKYHIGADRLTAKGYGEDKPLTSNDTKEGRAKNRRVELMPLLNK